MLSNTASSMFASLTSADAENSRLRCDFYAALYTASSAVSMSAEDMVGADVESKGVWDPLGLSKNEDSLYKYRAAELKHGRVAMTAVLGTAVQALYHWNDPVFAESRPLAALTKVWTERPEAILQIVAFVGAVELYFFKQEEDKAPGDFGRFSADRERSM